MDRERQIKRRGEIERERLTHNVRVKYKQEQKLRESDGEGRKERGNCNIDRKIDKITLLQYNTLNTIQYFLTKLIQQYNF